MTVPSDTNPLPELPLGKSLYDHMRDYLLKFPEAVETWSRAKAIAAENGMDTETETATLVLSAIEGIRDDIVGILRFVEAETKFYGYDPETKPGTRSIVIRHATIIDGQPYVTVQVLVGDLVQNTMRFSIESASNICDGFQLAIDEARNLE